MASSKANSTTHPKQSLREYQSDLLDRLGSTSWGGGTAPVRGLLGFESGGLRWLADLTYTGEVVPIPPITPVPRTASWFEGIASVRGSLYCVIDFHMFRCGQQSPRICSSRLLLLRLPYGEEIHSSLIIDGTLGLRSLEEMEPSPEQTCATDPAWHGASCKDSTGAEWNFLHIEKLAKDPFFLNVKSS